MKKASDKRIYVVGHLNPDTDSICSAIAYAHFLKERHKRHVIPARAGSINLETKFVLKKFKEKVPILLKDATNKNVIILDHNEIHQAVKNIREANILEIIDHHRIGDVETIHPIPFENEPRGATGSLIADRYTWFRIPFSRKMAGILLSAILSDTLLLKSPTTTPKDKILAKKLAKLAKVNIGTYGKEMLKAGCNIVKHSVNKLILTDFKTYTSRGHKVGIGQIPVIGFKEILKKKPELLKEMRRLKIKGNYHSLFVMITEVIEGNSYLLFIAKETEVKNKFRKKILEEGMIYLPNVVSRKKQVQLKVLEMLK